MQFRSQNLSAADQFIGKPPPILPNSSLWMQGYLYQVDSINTQYSYPTVALPAGITQQPGQPVMMPPGYSTAIVDGQTLVIGEGGAALPLGGALSMQAMPATTIGSTPVSEPQHYQEEPPVEGSVLNQDDKVQDAASSSESVSEIHTVEEQAQQKTET